MPSKLWYVVENTSEESVVIDGLGVVPPGVTMRYSQEAVDNFQYIRGLTLTQAKMPKGIDLHIVVVSGEEVN